jgi:FtsH-binding integral membrane protein
MADYDNRLARSADGAALAVDAGLRAYMLRVYNYMAGALALTGALALLTANTPLADVLYRQIQTVNGVQPQPTIAGLVALFAPFGLALYLQFRIQSLSFSAAQTMFWIYSALMGVSLSWVLLAYTGASVALTFFITAAMFGGMSIYGYTTKRDLTGFGSFLVMGVWGLIIAMLANMFFRSPAMDFVVSVLGVFIFTGLTAYYNQAIKNMYYAADDVAVMGKKAILGALVLYISFVNLFLFLMRFLGVARR